NKSNEDIQQFISLWLANYENDLGIKKLSANPEYNNYDVLEKQGKVKLKLVQSIEKRSRPYINAKVIKEIYEDCEKYTQKHSLPFTNFYIKLNPQPEEQDIVPMPICFKSKALLTVGFNNTYCVSSV